jgi:hypothetical protein
MPAMQRFLQRPFYTVLWRIALKRIRVAAGCTWTLEPGGGARAQEDQLYRETQHTVLVTEPIIRCMVVKKRPLF